MKYKKGMLFIVILLQVFMLTGCWDSKELSVIAITISMGIDKVGDEYMITQQVLNPKAIASKNPANEPAVLLYSEKGKDPFEILRRMTTMIDRKIYNSHMRVVVLGEDIARNNLNEIVDFLARDHEFRTDFYFLIAKGTTAYNVLSTLTPLESIPGIDISQELQISEEAWAPTKSIRIIELINDLISDGKEPVITGIEVTGGNNNTNNTNALTDTDVKNRLKLTCLGVFKENKLEGWLDEDESKGYNYIVGNIKNTVGYSVNYGSKITLELINEKADISAYMKNRKLAIKIDINAEENIAISDENLDVSKKENLGKLTDMAQEKIKEVCEKSLNRIQKELKSDVYGFGEVVHRTYPDEWKKLKKNWDDTFVNIPVEVNVEVKINRLGQIGKSFFIKEED